MSNPKSLALASCVFLLASLVPAQKVESAGPKSAKRSAAEQIGELLEASHAVGQFSGAALVADRGKVVYRGAYGVANADWEIPNQVDTKFRLASITKQFTAMLTLLLVKDGKLELDAPITRYLKGYPAASGDKVTIHHLLSHTSGIPSYTDREGFMQRDALHSMPVTEFVAKFCSEPLAFEPGSKFRYNNSGYFLLGAIIEQVTGTTYRAEMRARVFEPLGMRGHRLRRSVRGAAEAGNWLHGASWGAPNRAVDGHEHAVCRGRAILDNRGSVEVESGAAGEDSVGR